MRLEFTFNPANLSSHLKLTPPPRCPCDYLLQSHSVFALIMKISVDLVPRRILYLKRRTLVVLNNWLEMNNVKVKVEKLY